MTPDQSNPRSIHALYLPVCLLFIFNSLPAALRGIIRFQLITYITMGDPELYHRHGKILQKAGRNKKKQKQIKMAGERLEQMQERKKGAGHQNKTKRKQ